MFFLNRFPVCSNLFVVLFLVTSCVVVAAQPCMEWIKKKAKKTFVWLLVLGTSCSGRVLSWVQMLSGMESSRKSISVCSFKYKNWWKLVGPGIKIKDINIKIKDINIKFVDKLLVKIKSWYIWFCLHIKILPQFHVLEAWKNGIIWLDESENSWFSSFDFLEARQSSTLNNSWSTVIDCHKSICDCQKDLRRSLWLPLNRYSKNF